MAAPFYVAGNILPASDVDKWMLNSADFVTKASNQTVTSSTALVNDNALTLPVDASTTYLVYMMLKVDGQSAGDIKWQFTGPSGATFLGAAIGLDNAATLNTNVTYGHVSGLSVTSLHGTLGGGTPVAIECNGILTVSTTAGALTLQWAQGTSNATATTVFAGSFIKMIRVA